ncbi:hypothetical protein COCCADRAFT_32036 [Bipolaris zeicola 26-R-13]|uniref:Uncharacterized protein n=1 Tax=Cochliobolus carbonum (strain 26-R-13) TaxID=930089 RepID=W6YI53_COCC2|nr:uncharacterized protein COCCADRAFT_32036 [Bipolaris zeicola 26-R-13]EUC38992.1 hypothetical protein COCCADRAFT_32036 [Bipolaris zeicola 26-R-13]
MSTTHLTIHDLLRITYTYEMQAIEAQAQSQQYLQRPRSDSACSMPEICAHLSPPSPRLSSAYSNLEELETDFTSAFSQKKKTSV